MQKVIFVAAFVMVGILYASPAAACEECKQYFEWQSTQWCWYCEEYSSCGYFDCRIEESWFGDEYCTGDDGSCFEYGGNCAAEPSVDARPLDESWRLTNVRVIRPGLLQRDAGMAKRG